MFPSYKNQSNINESSYKQSYSNYVHDQFTGYLIEQMEFITEELQRFKNDIIHRLFKLVSVLHNEPFSSCKCEHTEISEKLVDKSVDPHEASLDVTSSDNNVNLIDNEVDEVHFIVYFYMITMIVILEAKKTILMPSVSPAS